jgi:adenylate cyclase
MSQTRQLAAIMFTDIVGYTSLMGKDEYKAMELLKLNRDIQKPLIEQYNGKWLKEMGDGVLASFNTVSDAVNCAKNIQEISRTEEYISLRIGIHQGEVVFEDGDVFGDGVNIASRIESIAPAGGIYISESVSRNIENKKGVKTKFVGEKTFKNVNYPVRIYEIVMDQEAKTKEKSNHNRSDNSIAVLPFVNMSSDPEQEYFSDGLTEEIITDLTQLGKLLVISRSSMMTFKGLNKKIKEIAEEVNVRYVLEGSVRKAGNNLRITAQLIDAQKDSHLWAEKYSGTVEDIFDIQEKVSKSIVRSLDIQLTRSEESQLVHHRFRDPRALEYFMQARYEMLKLTESGLLKAVALAEQGLEIVGENALLYGTLGLANVFLHHYGIRVTSVQLEKAREQANHSLSLDPECAPAHLVNGILEFYIEYNKQAAADIFKNILQFDKDNPDALRWLGLSYIVAGRVKEARPISKRLLQLDPMTPESRVFPGWVDSSEGLIQESIPHFEKWLQIDPDGPYTKYYSSLMFAINNEQSRSIKLMDSLIRMFPDSIYSKFAFFFRSALAGDKKKTLKYATEELKTNAEFLDWLSIGMTMGYALISEKDEAVKWSRIMLKQGGWIYLLYQQIDGLKDHAGFQEVMDEMKRRSEAFVI